MTDHPTRRDVLRAAGATTGLAALGLTVGCSDSDGAAPGTTASTTAPPAGVLGPLEGPPLLVVVELGGGNDGLSTLVPAEDATYQRLRPTLALGGDELVDFADGWSLNRRLAGLSERGMAVVAGLGTANPDLSHFEMLDRWWYGVPAGMTSAEKSQLGPGFLGRLCDAVQGDERFTGVSLRVGGTPALRAATSATTALPAGRSFIQDDALNGAAVSLFLDQVAATKGDGMLGVAREGTERLRWIADMLSGLPAPTGTYDLEDVLGFQLSFASQVLRSAAGVRVLHVPMGESHFDTHDKHGEHHPVLLERLGSQLSAFVDDIRAEGIADRVLIATISEFGRRVEEANGGLDHGAASVAMMLGPVTPGLHGEPSTLDRLDELGNLTATMNFDRYLATMAAWLEVDPASVLAAPDGRAPVEGLLVT